MPRLVPNDDGFPRLLFHLAHPSRSLPPDRRGEPEGAPWDGLVRQHEGDDALRAAEPEGPRTGVRRGRAPVRRARARSARPVRRSGQRAGPRGPPESDEGCAGTSHPTSARAPKRRAAAVRPEDRTRGSHPPTRRPPKRSEGGEASPAGARRPYAGRAGLTEVAEAPQRWPVRLPARGRARGARPPQRRARRPYDAAVDRASDPADARRHPTGDVRVAEAPRVLTRAGPEGEPPGAHQPPCRTLPGRPRVPKLPKPAAPPVPTRRRAGAGAQCPATRRGRAATSRQPKPDDQRRSTAVSPAARRPKPTTVGGPPFRRSPCPDRRDRRSGLPERTRVPPERDDHQTAAAEPPSRRPKPTAGDADHRGTKARRRLKEP